MNILIDALTSETLTENGAKTYSTSLNKNLDLFYSGAVVPNITKLESMITKALKENPLLALKISFYLRDVREGQGKRDVIRALVKVLQKENQTILTQILPFIPMIGRWKDVFENMLIYTEEQLELIKKMILVGAEDKSVVNLMAKWMPRKGINAVILSKLLGLSSKQYRRFVVDNSNTVEQLMCAKQWDEIEFEKVPSVASKIYQKAFLRNSEKYIDYINSLVEGKTKVNASILYPHEIVSAVKKDNGDVRVLDAQWKALPNFMEGAEKFNILPIIDTSGSMFTSAYGNITCLDISVGLGIYLSQHNKGVFKNLWCNFSENPSFYYLEDGDIKNVIDNLDYENWGGNTNLNAVFTKLLATANQFNVSENDMPKVILIVSDMEFDDCGDLTNYEEIKEQYKQSGYEVPSIVFWNVQSRAGNVPVRFNEDGVALIGGYSPIIMKDILSGGLKDMTPLSIMLKTIEGKYEYLDSINFTI